MADRSLLWLLLVGALRVQPARLAFCVLCIALGVALGLAVAIINRSAIASFSQALQTVHGSAQASVIGRGGKLHDEDFAAVAGLAQVVAASPVIALDQLPVFDKNRRLLGRVRVVGVDFLRIGEVSAALFPRLGGVVRAETTTQLFAPDQVFVSVAAQQLLKIQVDDEIRLDASANGVSFKVAGDLPLADPGAALIVMDIGTAQWRLGWLGRLSHIDLRLAEGASVDSLNKVLAPHLLAQTPQSPVERVSNLSRAYRVNLNLLALVALLTGGFVVATSLALLVRREQPSLALLQVLGADRTLISRYVLLLGGLLGLAGALLGIGFGIGIAQALLVWRGGGLGSAFFDWRTRSIVVEPLTMLAFLLLGVSAGLLGAASPARQAWSSHPSATLKSAGSEISRSNHFAGSRRAIGLCMITLVLAMVMVMLPAWNGIAVGAYISMALILVGGLITVRPALGLAIGWLLKMTPGLWPRYPTSWMAIHSLAHRPSLQSGALGAVVASFALACAMSIMVASFRTSVDRWLGQVLPADLYVRSAGSSGQSGLTPDQQQALQTMPGVNKLEFFRSVDITLDSGSIPVSLLARPLNIRQTGLEPKRVVPLTGEYFPPPAGMTLPIVFVSEAVQSLHNIQPGARLRLPLGKSGAEVWVAGVWRDYGRPAGAIVMDQAAYAALSGDTVVSDAAISLTNPAADTAIWQQHPALQALEITSSSAIRKLSLEIFDRSFVVTRLLEWAAMLLGLFGVGSLLAAEALARRKEFGLLLHLGFEWRQLRKQLVLEAALQVALATAWGLLVGAVLSLVLIYRVNPQSFHWSMDLHWPITTLLANALALVAIACVVTGAVAYRIASMSPAQAVRQEW